MKGKWTIAGILSAGLLLALAMGFSHAQGPEPPGEGVQPEGEISIQAAVSAVIPIQGRLTDASGNPLNGNYSITASIYDTSSGGTALCSDTDTVPVNNGLFTMSVDNCTSDDIDGRQLYLGIKVGSDAEMTPRQAIYPVPYAFSLRPGAVISDSASIHTLVLTNNGPDSNNHALHAYSKSSNAVFAYTHSPHAAVAGENYGTSGDRIGVYGYTNSTSGYGVTGFQTGYSTADHTSPYNWYKPGGFFGGLNGVIGVTKQTNGVGVLGWDKSGGKGIFGVTDSSSGWAGYFYTTQGNGVYISAPAAKTGLNVAGGSKNAVVRTNDGSRLLYTEESTEVWFTDYGFGKLQNGAAVVAIDPVFAQTVNLNEPYHVFVQAYGNASLYVTNRTATGFEVRLHDGDPNVEFSYRIVARRLGYEDQRLERAPWADNDPNLYPEKRTAWEAQQGGEP